MAFQVPVDLKADGKEPRKRKVRDLVRNKANIVTGSPRLWERITTSLTLKRNEELKSVVFGRKMRKNGASFMLR